ncbi:MAG TPA: D-alanine--D-alanine ligase [Thermoanaerobaculia bacterium]|nr:D-alanine--D-alanine ligase [Thermoanaerobaculia bacterium]
MSSPQKPLAIALAYDLKSEYLAAGFSPEEVMEFDDEDTVAALAATLEEMGHRVERVGCGIELAKRLAAGRRWDLVFTIAEGVRGRSREAQVPAVCELFGQPYTFSDPLTSAITLDKPMAKRLVRDLGLPTADFVMVTHPEEADTVALAPPLFAKPIAEGSSKGIDGHSKVANREELRRACGELLEAFGQPVLVESYLPGREVTVGIVGNGAAALPVGTMEIAFTKGCDREFYTALNKGEFEERVSYRLLDGEPLGERARQIALAVYHALGCRDAARIDLRCDAAGEPQFLEVNPLPGLHPTRSDLPIMCKLGGIDYRELLARIVAAAAERWGL